MNLDQLIVRLSEIRNQTSGGTEIFVFHPDEGCLSLEDIGIMECDDDIPDYIIIGVEA